MDSVFCVRFLSGAIVTLGLLVWRLMNCSDFVKLWGGLSVADLACTQTCLHSSLFLIKPTLSIFLLFVHIMQSVLQWPYLVL